MISGTPTEDVSSTFIVEVSSGGGADARELTLDVQAAALVISAGVLARPLVGASYSDTLEASGGTGAYEWSIIRGSLPLGLTISPDGVISGTPEFDHAYAFTVQATSGRQEATRSLGLTVELPSPVPWASVDASLRSCAITVTGSGFCWGYRSSTGTGYAGEPVAIPTRIQAGVRWALMQDGCMVAMDGAGYCYSALVPGTWKALDRFVWHSCGIATSGDAYCWGSSGRSGELGNGSRDSSSAPVLVAGGHKWASISVGPHNCGVTVAGEAYCWGPGGHGSLGNGSTEVATVPVRVSGSHSWKLVTVGNYFTCGLTTKGEAYCWGKGGDHLGIGSSDTLPVTEPVRVAGGHRWVSLSAGPFHACGVTADAAAYCWGPDEIWHPDLRTAFPGRLGTGNGASSNVPVRVAGDLRWLQISAGQLHSCAVTTERRVACWGLGKDGLLGNGETVTSYHSTVPVLVLEPGR